MTPNTEQTIEVCADDDNEFSTTVQEQSFNLAHAKSLLNSKQPFPREFGDYILKSELGRGSTGIVYVATKRDSNEVVAIKIVSDGDCQVGERFEREVQALANLDHPNICPVIDVGEVGNDRYFTMPYVRGKTLYQFVCRDKVLPVKEIARILKAVARAVQHAHDVGVVHRDLKPANIIIQPNGQPMIIDFGLAMFLCRASDLVQEGQVVGTPAYMAPEQVLGKLDLVGPASDIHALGAIMYHLLTCRLPYDGSIERIFDQILNDEPELPSRFRGRLHVGLEQICLKAMAKEIDKRHHSAEFFAQEVHSFEQVRLRSKQRRYLNLKSRETDLAKTDIRDDNRPRFRSSNDNDNPNPSLRFALFAAVVWVLCVIAALLCRGRSSEIPTNSFADHQPAFRAIELDAVSQNVADDTVEEVNLNRPRVERIQRERFWKQLSGLDQSINKILAKNSRPNKLKKSKHRLTGP